MTAPAAQPRMVQYMVPGGSTAPGPVMTIAGGAPRQGPLLSSVSATGAPLMSMGSVRSVVRAVSGHAPGYYGGGGQLVARGPPRDLCAAGTVLYTQPISEEDLIASGNLIKDMSALDATMRRAMAIPGALPGPPLLDAPAEYAAAAPREEAVPAETYEYQDFPAEIGGAMPDEAPAPVETTQQAPQFYEAPAPQAPEPPAPAPQIHQAPAPQAPVATGPMARLMRAGFNVSK